VLSAWGDRPVVKRPKAYLNDPDGGPDANIWAWGDRPVVKRPKAYLNDPDGGPDANKMLSGLPAINEEKTE